MAKSAKNGAVSISPKILLNFGLIFPKNNRQRVLRVAQSGHTDCLTTLIYSDAFNQCIRCLVYHQLIICFVF